jgi:hypothetical protein
MMKRENRNRNEIPERQEAGKGKEKRKKRSLLSLPPTTQEMMLGNQTKP